MTSAPRKDASGQGPMTAALPLLILLTGIALVPATGEAEVIYHWVDEQGVEHFSQQAPEGVQAEEYSVQDGIPVTSGINPTRGMVRESPQEAEQAELAREQQITDARQLAAERERIAAACEEQRERLPMFEARPRVLVREEDGTVRQLDSTERLKAIADMKAFIEANCD
jgi:hypothetical protein